MAQRKCAKLSRSSSCRLVKNIFWAMPHFNATKCYPLIRFISLLSSCSEMQYFICLCTMICFKKMPSPSPDTSQETKFSLVSQSTNILRGLRGMVLLRNRTQKTFILLSRGSEFLWNCRVQATAGICLQSLSRQWTLIHGKMPHSADPKKQSNKKKSEVDL